MACTGEPVTEARNDGGSDSTTTDSAATDSTATDSSVTDSATTTDTTSLADGEVPEVKFDTGPTPCPSGRGPEMIYIPDRKYCVDRTEVTEAQFSIFLAVAVKPKVDRPFCDTRPYRMARASDGERPAVDLDWCNAYVFCKWAGKRLCGKHYGGSLKISEASAANSQWIYACRGGDPGTKYPYGSTFDPTKCNVDEDGVGTATKVGQYPQCTPLAGSPGAGVLDMSGNVREWDDSCDGPIDGDSGTTCSTNGGYAGSSAGQAGCNEATSWGHTSSDDTVGFRCCYDVP